MIRIFLAILAVIAAVLGYILAQPLLYAAAGAFVLITLVVLLTGNRKRPVSASASQRTDGEDGDLASLGILEIKPKAAQQGTAQPVRAAEQARPVVAASAKPASEQTAAPAEPATATPASTPSSATPRAADSATPSVGGRLRRRTQVLEPILQALRGSIDAHTACLLKLEADGSYHIEAASSRSSYARTSGHFSTQGPLDAGRSGAVEVYNVEAFPSGGLNYYRESVPVRQVALTDVPGPDAGTYLLLADALEPTDLDQVPSHRLMRQFAAMLSTVLYPDAQEPEAAAPERAQARPRPRRDIIAEEMDEARAGRQQLALALVYQHETEEFVANGSVAEAEALLHARLQQAAPDSRVERFGELTYGMFYRGDDGEVDDWVHRLQDHLGPAAVADAPPLSIGIALLQDRHEDADTFRADATEALREAYETGTCTVLE